MSNYHYYENRSCGCAGSGSYSNLEGSTGGDDCLPSCMNRFEKERSVKDQMDYKVFVLNQPNSFYPNSGQATLSRENWDAKIKQYRIPTPVRNPVNFVNPNNNP